MLDEKEDQTYKKDKKVTKPISVNLRRLEWGYMKKQVYLEKNYL